MQLTVPPIKYREIFSSQLLLKFLQVTYLLLPFNLRLHLSINTSTEENEFSSVDVFKGLRVNECCFEYSQNILDSILIFLYS